MMQFHLISLFILTVSQFTFGQHSNNSNLNHVCNEELGCFDDRAVFGPHSLKDIDLKFKLFTNQNLNNSIDFTFDFGADQILNSTFDSRKYTIFIIHGYTSFFDEKGWTGKLKNAILHSQFNKYNVFGVDWTKGAKFWNYITAAANVQVVGTALADFITRLVVFTHTKYSYVHLIGHSLGSHIAGHAGRRIQNPKIARITGLDAAGPRFRRTNESLSASDANYVENIHTNSAANMLKGFGLEEAIATVDFYPNGGYSQPICSDEMLEKAGEKGFFHGLSETFICDHQFAHRLMRIMPSDLPEKCQFVGIQCQDYDRFKQGLCDCGVNNTKCAILSLFGSNDPEIRYYYKKQLKILKAGAKYYFVTTDTPPYCVYHYIVTVNFVREFNGDAIVEVYGSAIHCNFTLKSGQSKFLLTLEHALGDISKVVLKSVEPYAYIPVEIVSVAFLSNINPKVREEWSAVLVVFEVAENRSHLTAYPAYIDDSTEDWTADGPDDNLMIVDH